MIKLNRAQALYIVENYNAASISKDASDHEKQVWFDACVVCEDSLIVFNELFGEESDIEIILSDSLVSRLAVTRSFA